MTFMPDAHRPKAVDEAGCWAGGNFACDAPASEPLGLCDRHRDEITGDEPRNDGHRIRIPWVVPLSAAVAAAERFAETMESVMEMMDVTTAEMDDMEATAARSRQVVAQMWADRQEDS